MTLVDDIHDAQAMTCDHRLIQKQWMLGQMGYEDSCPECDKKRIAELRDAVINLKDAVRLRLAITYARSEREELLWVLEMFEKYEPKEEQKP